MLGIHVVDGPKIFPMNTETHPEPELWIKSIKQIATAWEAIHSPNFQTDERTELFELIGVLLDRVK